MSGRFVASDRPVGSEDGAFFASHTPRLPAVRTERVIRGFVGVGHQRLGREAGRFRAIKLIVRRNDVFVVDVRATFRSGETQDLALRQPIRAGGETGLLTLAPSPRGDKAVFRNPVADFVSAYATAA